MKKILQDIFIVVIIVFVIDNIVGYFLDKYCVFYDNPIVTEACNNKSKLIFMGSSEAECDFVPGVVADSLNISAYNYGMSYEYIFFHYGLLNLILNNAEKPDIVIYETHFRDIYDLPGQNAELLDKLMPYYGFDDSVRSVVNLRGWSHELFLNVLRTSKHNTAVFNYAYGIVRPDTSRTAHQGQLVFPVRSIDSSRTVSYYNEDPATEVNQQKIEYIERLISLCNKNEILLVFVNAPTYRINSGNGFWINKIRKLAVKHGVPFIDYNTEPYSSYYRSHPEWFHDEVHMNEVGANVFTKELVQDIKGLL